MEVGNSLAKSIAWEKRAYDEACKLVLADSQVRSRILQAYVPEFAAMAPREIEKLLGEDVEVGVEPVDGVESALVARGHANLNTEDSTLNEGTAHFDVRFSVPVPGGGRAVVEIDLEAQNAWRPGYPLASRAAFYCARMLSAQGSRILPKSKYGELNKVYSLWVCSHPDEAHRGHEDAFAVRPLGDHGVAYEGYDLMEFRFVCLDENCADASYGCLGLLSALFTQRLDLKELRRTLVDDFDMILTEDIEERIGRMCNFSEGVWEDGKAEGRAEDVLALMRRKCISLVQALDWLDVPAEERKAVADLVAAMS